MKIKAELKGLDNLKKKFDQLEKVTQGKILANAVQSGANPILNMAIEKTPWLTGNLRRSLHSELVNTSNTHAEADIGTDVEYAPFVEFGTSKQAAQPYLRPAFDTQQNAAIKEIGDALKAQIENV